MFWTKTSGISVPLAESVPVRSDWDILAAIWAAGPVVKAVMLILLAFSIISWAIIIAKFRRLNRAQQETAAFLNLFWLSPTLAAAYENTRHLTLSPAAAIFRQGYAAVSQANPTSAENNQSEDIARSLMSREEAAQRAVRHALTEQVQRLTQSLSFLATCGNTAPFIGLFGTVWGIMTSFHEIGLKGSASLATVAPGIAEALIATAAGLAAAIPAVMAYNYFLGRVQRLEADLESFAGDLLDLLKSSWTPAGLQGE
jgi:biopolymer transport protein TolQ